MNTTGQTDLASKVGETVKGCKVDGIGSEIEGVGGGGEEDVSREHVAGHVSELHHVSRLEDLGRQQAMSIAQLCSMHKIHSSAGI